AQEVMIPIAFTRSVRVLRLALLLLLPYAVPAQEHPPRLLEKGSWDIGVWIAGATGEENRNSFTEAQIWSAECSSGKSSPAKSALVGCVAILSTDSILSRYS